MWGDLSSLDAKTGCVGSSARGSENSCVFQEQLDASSGGIALQQPLSS